MISDLQTHGQAEEQTLSLRRKATKEVLGYTNENCP
jgi:hypothetical protein